MSCWTVSFAYFSRGKSRRLLCFGLGVVVVVEVVDGVVVVGAGVVVVVVLVDAKIEKNGIQIRELTILKKN